MALQDVTGALDRVVQTVARTAGDDRDRAHLVELLELFGTDDERVTTARRALARAVLTRTTRIPLCGSSGFLGFASAAGG